MMINSDEFIRHTENMTNLAKKRDDFPTQLFFEDVIVYIKQYLDIFGKGA